MSLTTIEHYALLAYLRLLAFLFNDTIPAIEWENHAIERKKPISHDVQLLLSVITLAVFLMFASASYDTKKHAYTRISHTKSLPLLLGTCKHQED